MDKEPIEGGLFRRNYIHHPALVADSPRARKRISAVFYARKAPEGPFANAVERRLGIKYPISDWGLLHEAFWTKSDISDVLSAITIWFQQTKDEKMLDEMRLIFAEEQLRYGIDDKGGVHFAVDEAFERDVHAAIAGLGSPKFKASLNAFEAALDHLGPVKQSGKGLIRGVFEAVESAFLVIVGKGPNLINDQATDKYLKPILLKQFAAHPDAADLVKRQLDVLNAWVKAGHQFRHGAGHVDDIHEAPLDVAVLYATQGAGILRFLAGLPTQP